MNTIKSLWGILWRGLVIGACMSAIGSICIPDDASLWVHVRFVVALTLMICVVKEME